MRKDNKESGVCLSQALVKLFLPGQDLAEVADPDGPGDGKNFKRTLQPDH